MARALEPHPGALSLIGEPSTFGVHPEDYEGPCVDMGSAP
jgi:hypothetical protein